MASNQKQNRDLNNAITMMNVILNAQNDIFEKQNHILENIAMFLDRGLEKQNNILEEVATAIKSMGRIVEKQNDIILKEIAKTLGDDSVEVQSLKIDG